LSLATLLVNRCTINRKVSTNTHGVITNAWSAAATGVRCNLQEKSGEVQHTMAGEVLKYDAKCFFLPTTDVRPFGTHDVPDQIVITKPATSAKFLVLHVYDDTGHGKLRVAYLQRLGSA